MMNMTVKIERIRKDEFQTDTWSGGTTTQLSIYPSDAKYIDRNFIWRLSSAKVEIEESVFTSLPDINRVIMIIDGELVLDHEGHHRSILRPYEQDAFSGNWTTKSNGRVTDFNLMMAPGCTGSLEALHIEPGKSQCILLKDHGYKKNKLVKWVQAFYCVEGHITIQIASDEIWELTDGDILVLTGQDHFIEIDATLNNPGDRIAHLIKSSIRY